MREGYGMVAGFQKWQEPGEIEKAGLCSKGARVPQATNFCLWATR